MIRFRTLSNPRGAAEIAISKDMHFITAKMALQV
jgi:hypothetical protein